MSLMMIIPWGGVCGQPSGGGQLHCDGKLCGGGYGGAGGHQGTEKTPPRTLRPIGCFSAVSVAVRW